jgi:hypothetical protein
MRTERKWVVVIACACLAAFGAAGCDGGAKAKATATPAAETPEQRAQREQNLKAAEQIGRQSEKYATQWKNAPTAGGAKP